GRIIRSKCVVSLAGMNEHSQRLIRCQLMQRVAAGHFVAVELSRPKGFAILVTLLSIVAPHLAQIGIAVVHASVEYAGEKMVQSKVMQHNEAGLTPAYLPGRK